MFNERLVDVFPQGGVQLQSDDRIIVDNDAGTVNFTKLYTADEGQYTCKALNDVGEDSAVGQLHVLGELVTRILAFMRSFCSGCWCYKQSTAESRRGAVCSKQTVTSSMSCAWCYLKIDAHHGKRLR